MHAHGAAQQGQPGGQGLGAQGGGGVSGFWHGGVARGVKSDYNLRFSSPSWVVSMANAMIDPWRVSKRVG